MGSLAAVVQQQGLASPAVQVVGNVAAAGAALGASNRQGGQVQAARAEAPRRADELRRSGATMG